MRPHLLLISCTLFILFTACSEDPLDVDVSGVELDIQTQRLDQDFFQVDFNQVEESNEGLRTKYGAFYSVYLEEILKVGPADRPESLSTAEDFCTDYYMKQAYDAIQEVHNPRMDEYQAQLEDAFRHFKYHFPEVEVPNVIYYHSGFNYGIFSMDSTIAVGLDWFLGRDHPITQSLPFPRYRQEKMDPEFLVANVLKDWSNRFLYREIAGDNLLQTLVYYGKIMYLVDACMPSTADSIKINYRSAQIDWCRENEFKIWKELASDQSTLYETKAFEINKWVNDGPFTSGLPQESPGMVGIWVGWMMVRDHHARFPELSLKEVLDSDETQILRSYNPKP